MTPELRNEFEISWRDLHPRLRAMLAARRVDLDHHEDLIQETALRLYGMWERVDRTRPSWPLAKTIVLNLLRDECRTRRITEPLEGFPEQAFDYDLEAQGIARIELDKVRVALGSLTELQRRALLVEIGLEPGGEPSAANKMVRMRARKRLASLLEEVSALISLRWAKMPDLLQGAGLLRGSGNAAVACFACIFGVSVAAINIGPLTEQAEARPQLSTPVSRSTESASSVETYTSSALLTRDSLQAAASAGRSENFTGSKKTKKSVGSADPVDASGPRATDSGSTGSSGSKAPGASDLGVPSAPSREEVPDAPDLSVSVSPTPGSDPEGERGAPALDVERATTVVASLSSLDSDPLP